MNIADVVVIRCLSPKQYYLRMGLIFLVLLFHYNDYALSLNDARLYPVPVS